MPLFDYKCLTCGEIEERLVPLQEIDDQYCSVCQEQLVKQVGTVSKAILLTGGFYETDYKKQGE